MPLTDTMRCPEVTRPQPFYPKGIDPSRDVFFATLFWALERSGVRYCALHAQGGLLYGSDIALHRADQRKLFAVFADLKETGFSPVQWLETEPGEYRIVLARIVDSTPETVAVDFVLGSRGGVGAEKIVEQRRREGKFWVCASEAFERDTAPAPALSTRIGYWMRRLRNRLSPGGLCLVFLGPDGVGKTTLQHAVTGSLTAVFPEQSFYRWRPAVFARAPRPNAMPHSKPMRSWWGSISYLFFTCLDFASGYVVAIRSVLCRSGLVTFDRNYHDMLIDPQRYGYPGPMGLARAMGRVVPPRDCFFVVLDADEQTILSRKQQLPAEDIRRMRRAYREFAASAATAVLISTDNPLEQCRAEVLERIFQHLTDRLAERNPAWFKSASVSFSVDSTVPPRKEEHAYSAIPALLPKERLDCKPTLNSVPPQP